MDSWYNLSLTVDVTESAGEIISTVSIVKCPPKPPIDVTNSSISEAGNSNSSDDGDFELVVPIPHGLDLCKPFYLYVPSVHLYDDQTVHRKLLVRSGITVFQDISNISAAVLTILTDEKSSALLSAKMLEVKIRDLNVATVHSFEGMAGVVAPKSKNKYESKLAQECIDAPDGASDIYKCQIHPVNNNDVSASTVEKIYRSTYFLCCIRNLPHLVTKIIRPFCLAHSAHLADPSRLDHYTSELSWEPIFSLLLLTTPSKRSAIEQCLKLQQEIEKVKALDAAILPHANGLGDFGSELSNKCYFKLKNLEHQLGDEGAKLLSGKSE